MESAYHYPAHRADYVVGSHLDYIASTVADRPAPLRPPSPEPVLNGSLEWITSAHLRAQSLPEQLAASVAQEAVAQRRSPLEWSALDETISSGKLRSIHRASWMVRRDAVRDANDSVPLVPSRFSLQMPARAPASIRRRRKGKIRAVRKLALRRSEADNVSPLPATRPTDPCGMVAYDTIRSLWRPKRMALTAEDIRKGLRDFVDVADRLRERWFAIEKAEAEKKTAAADLKDQYEHQRRLLNAALVAAREHGHEVMLEMICGHGRFIMYLVKVLHERIREDDYSSLVVQNVLRFLALVSPTQTLLDQVKFSRVRSRLEKRGTDQVRDLLKKVYDRVKPDPTSPAPNASILNESSSEKVARDPATGEKRAREDDSAAAQPAKKLGPSSAVAPKEAASGAASASKSAAARSRTAGAPLGVKVAAAVVSTRPAASFAKAPVLPGAPSSRLPSVGASRVIPTATAGSATSGTTSGTSARPKVTQPAPPASNFFAGLKSASKVTPGSGQGLMKYAQSGASSKPGAKSGSNGNGSRSAFSIIQTLDSLEKSQAKESTPEKTDQYAGETEEARAKRLRKEERRKLRVTFKTGDDLVQVHFFSRDLAEDQERDENFLRDADNAAAEGRAFMQHADVTMKDEEDDYEPPDVVGESGPFGALQAGNLYGSGVAEPSLPLGHTGGAVGPGLNVQLGGRSTTPMDIDTSTARAAIWDESQGSSSRQPQPYPLPLPKVPPPNVAAVLEKLNALNPKTQQQTQQTQPFGRPAPPTATPLPQQAWNTQAFSHQALPGWNAPPTQPSVHQLLEGLGALQPYSQVQQGPMQSGNYQSQQGWNAPQAHPLVYQLSQAAQLNPSHYPAQQGFNAPPTAIMPTPQPGPSTSTAPPPLLGATKSMDEMTIDEKCAHIQAVAQQNRLDVWPPPWWSDSAYGPPPPGVV
ncbi:MAG: hypothetical protein M1826_006435 [Phylliscum demangeonii]|nr:MAG: hypothetical protein M1826_006435 [Phylliscum demangeonii]